MRSTEQGEWPADLADAVHRGQKLAAVMNEALAAAANSTGKKGRERLSVAVAALAALETVAGEQPRLSLPNLAAVHADIERLQAKLAPRRRSIHPRSQVATGGLDLAANQYILSGLVFYATLQLRTPLRVLLRDGEVHQSLTTRPPKIARVQWEGFWSPMTKTWKELTGVEIEEFEPSTRASDIGQVPFNGGDYLRFLVRVRGISEGKATASVRASRLAEELRRDEWAAIVDRLGGAQSIIARLAK